MLARTTSLGLAFLLATSCHEGAALPTVERTATELVGSYGQEPPDEWGSLSLDLGADGWFRPFLDIRRMPGALCLGRGHVERRAGSSVVPDDDLRARLG